MRQLTVPFGFAFYRSIYCFVGSLLAICLSVARADSSGIGIQLPTSVRVADAELLSEKQPWTTRLRVSPGGALRITGCIVGPDLTNYSSRISVAFVRFCDKDGNEVRTEQLQYSNKFNSPYFYIATGPRPRCFTRDILVPPTAVSVEVKISRFYYKKRILLHDFSCISLEPNSCNSFEQMIGKDLPFKSESPISVVRDVMPGQMVHVKFRTSSADRPNAKMAFSLSFFDVDGVECLGRYWDVAYSSKFTAPISQPPHIGDEVEVNRIVPPYAVAVKITLQGLSDDVLSKFEAFDLDIRSPSVGELLLHSNVWWRYMPWFGLAVFLFVCVIGIKRLLSQEDTLRHRICGIVVVGIVAMFVAHSAWCLGDVFASDHNGTIKSIAVFALLLFALCFMFNGLDKESFMCKHPVLCLSIIAMVVHIMVIVWCNRYFHQQMTSDALLAQRCLEAGTIHTEHGGCFPYWCNYELLLSMIGVVFGPNLCVGQVLNAVCCVGMLYPIYDLSRTIATKKSALFVIASFVCYPTNYFHSTLLTPEHLCAFLICWAMWFISRTLQTGIFTSKGILCAVLCGSLLGLSQLIKPVSSIMLIAIGLCFIVSVIGNRGWNILNNAAVALAVFASFLGMSKCGQEAFCYIANPYPVAPRQFNMLTRVLSVGLDVKGRGKNTKALGMRYWESSEEKRKRDVFQSMRTDYIHYPVLVAEKFDRVYGSEEGLRRWFNTSIKRRRNPGFDRFVDNYYYLFRVLAFMGAIGFALSCFARKISKQIFSVEMFMPLFVCGFCMMLMICEAQGRYRVPTHPESFIMLAYLPAFVKKCKAVFRQIGFHLGWRGKLQGLMVVSASPSDNIKSN